VAHSDDNKDTDALTYIKDNTDSYILLPNIAPDHDKYTLPSAAICRNYSVGFRKLRETTNNLDAVIGATGDTLFFDINQIKPHVATLRESGLVLQAVGHDFHSSNADPANGIEGGRLQGPDTTDIMPQFFVFRGDFFYNTNLLLDIKITNPFTSEQCLGDNIIENLSQKFHTCIRRLGVHAYDFSDGITLQSCG